LTSSGKVEWSALARPRRCFWNVKLQDIRLEKVYIAQKVLSVEVYDFKAGIEFAKMSKVLGPGLMFL